MGLVMKIRMLMTLMAAVTKIILLLVTGTEITGTKRLSRAAPAIPIMIQMTIGVFSPKYSKARGYCDNETRRPTGKPKNIRPSPLARSGGWLRQKGNYNQVINIILYFYEKFNELHGLILWENLNLLFLDELYDYSYLKN
jgi:hypothetical protein